MKVWVFQTGEPLPVDKGNPRPMRAINLCNELVKAGHSVVLWSADFSHLDKRPRFNKNHSVKVNENLEVRLIKSRGYKKNIGFERLLDHAQLAFNLHSLLKAERQLPDVAFIGYPPIETAYFFMRWLSKRKVPSLLDIKDQWPVIFVEALPALVQPLGYLIFWPYFFMAKSSIRMATGISTMANSFLEWSLTFSGRRKNKFDRIFPLTSPATRVSNEQSLEVGKWWDERGIYDDGRPKICFVGSLSPAFDFLPVREAAQMAQEMGDDTKFIICGDGNSASEIQLLMKGLPNVIFPGWIDRPKIEVLAQRCIAALTPYVNSANFTMNLPNKVIDALSLGLPLLSPLTGEVKLLIVDNKVGYHYCAQVDRNLFHCLQRLTRDPDQQAEMSKNARKLYHDRFSYSSVYGSLVEHLEQLSLTK